MRNADMPAMTSGALYDESVEDVIPHRGLTKREHFAAMAMQGFMANWDPDLSRDDYAHDFAYMAIRQADALLAALERN